jgi:hypothetical protein
MQRPRTAAARAGSAASLPHSCRSPPCRSHRTSVQPQRTRDRTGRPARVCRSGRRPRPSWQLIGGRDLRCPRQDGTCPRRRSAGPQPPDTARSGRNCGHGSPPPGPARTAWALLHERRTVNPPIPARQTFSALARGRPCRRPPAAAILAPVMTPVLIDH